MPAKNFRCGISVKNLPVLLQFEFTISIHAQDVVVEGTFALHISEVTWAQIIKDPPVWWQPSKEDYCDNCCSYLVS